MGSYSLTAGLRRARAVVLALAAMAASCSGSSPTGPTPPPGGVLTITCPAPVTADLAVAAALVSSLTGEPVPADAVVFGEIGLSGEVRAVGQSDTRLKEAAKLGFSSAIFPARRTGKKGGRGDNGLKTVELQQLGELMPLFQSQGSAGRPPSRRPHDDNDTRRRRDDEFI